MYLKHLKDDLEPEVMAYIWVNNVSSHVGEVCFRRLCGLVHLAKWQLLSSCYKGPKLRISAVEGFGL